MHAFTHPALEVFAPLPLKERLFVRGRLFTAPLPELAARAQGPRVLDVGCGHGVLSTLIHHQHPDWQVTGIDPDGRKIAWARTSLGRRPNTRFVQTTSRELSQSEPHAFDSVCVADVMYLLPTDAWAGFLADCHALLVPGGRLVLKEMEDDGSWRVKKALWQELLMVKVLRRTHGSGAIGISRREVMLSALQVAGFTLEETVVCSQGYSTPHVLYVARSA
jgi:2-polyprenyl-6-hydroxyphenyl methylase/3-demethylubiquinone-9 3-methyltransferase